MGKGYVLALSLYAGVFHNNTIQIIEIDEAGRILI